MTYAMTDSPGSTNAPRGDLYGKRLLLINGAVLGLIALGAGGIDLLGYFTGKGPIGPFVGQPVVVGLFEAHGLALMLCTLMLVHRNHPTAHWNVVAATMHLLFGCSNLIFWQFFVDTNAVPMGTVITVMHFAFFVLESVAVALRMSATAGSQQLAGRAT